MSGPDILFKALEESFKSCEKKSREIQEILKEFGAEVKFSWAVRPEEGLAYAKFEVRAKELVYPFERESVMRLYAILGPKLITTVWHEASGIADALETVVVEASKVTESIAKEEAAWFENFLKIAKRAATLMLAAKKRGESEEVIDTAIDEFMEKLMDLISSTPLEKLKEGH